MVSMAVWSAPDGGTPRRLPPSPPHSEAVLEEWVRADSSLVRDGLVVVAQQLVFSSRDRLDLLCIEGRSRWLIVELKRDRMAREVASQALDYVSLLKEMTVEELETRLSRHLVDAPQETRDLVADLLAGETDENPRDVAVVVVGISADEPLLRITSFLSEQYAVPISVVELQAFKSPSGDLIILREETGSDEGATSTLASPSASVEDRWARVRENAADRGFGEALAAFKSLVQQAGLYLRPYTRSAMITPPHNRTRYLGVVSFEGTGGADHAEMSYGSDAFAEFYPEMTVEKIHQVLGNSYGPISPNELVEFGHRIASLMSFAENPRDDVGSAM